MAKNRTDTHVLLKISKYVKQLEKAHDKIKDIDVHEYEDELYAYAIAQLITNLKNAYEMFKSEALQERYKLLRQPSIVRIRNIAAHDYEALDWGIVKNGCSMIIKQYTREYNDESLKLLDENEIDEIESRLTRLLDSE